MSKLLLRLAMLLALGTGFAAYGAAVADKSEVRKSKQVNYRNMMNAYERSRRVEDLEAILTTFSLDPAPHPIYCMGIVQDYLGGEYEYGKSRYEELRRLAPSNRRALAREALEQKLALERSKIADLSARAYSCYTGDCP